MQPQLDMVAASQPLEATRDVITEARQSPSAESYLQQTASSQAKSTGTMSERELESFEVGHRYANTAWVTDLQGMDGDNLTRENVMKQAANLKDFDVGMLLPGIKINTSPTDFYPVKQIQMMRFRGETWELFGPIFSGEDLEH